MKLLLTSNGLANDSIAQALEGLVGKPPTETKIAFIPTAAHAERNNKAWLITDLYRLLQRGYYVDIVELTATEPAQLTSILKDKDVIFMGGGNAFYLSYWVQKSGLAKLLPTLLKTKVYAGISAGSIIAGTSLMLTSQALHNPQAFKKGDFDILGPSGASSGIALRLADIVFRPHLNSPHFTVARESILREKIEGVHTPVYAIDDNSALKIVDKKVQVVSEGKWLLLNDARNKS